MKAIIAIVLLAVIGVIALFAMSSHTVLTINPEVKIVGVTTPVTVKISNPHGVRRTAAYIEQAGARFPLTEVKTPAHRFFWRRRQKKRWAGVFTSVSGKRAPACSMYAAVRRTP